MKQHITHALYWLLAIAGIACIALTFNFIPQDLTQTFLYIGVGCSVLSLAFHKLATQNLKKTNYFLDKKLKKAQKMVYALQNNVEGVVNKYQEIQDHSKQYSQQLLQHVDEMELQEKNLEALTHNSESLLDEELASNHSGHSQEWESRTKHVRQHLTELRQQSQALKELNPSFSSLGECMVQIEEMVVETRLLSFNASVEAARAGSQGLGFAVVADEIAILAQHSLSITERMQEPLMKIEVEFKKVGQDCETCYHKIDKTLFELHESYKKDNFDQLENSEQLHSSLRESLRNYIDNLKIMYESNLNLKNMKFDVNSFNFDDSLGSLDNALGNLSKFLLAKETKNSKRNSPPTSPTLSPVKKAVGASHSPDTKTSQANEPHLRLVNSNAQNTQSHIKYYEV